jgi:predicted ATP-grasp superfamily ATP-dependent carboligase
MASPTIEATEIPLAQPVPELDAARPAHPAAGAMVIGGDYQGLGIVRSLGRRGVPVCVVDDEHSISRFSRYAKSFVHLADLRDQRTAVDGLLKIGRRLGLEGWVLYPTREELVAAFSHNRAKLSQVFRVPTPDWESVKWAWDKRNTYRLAQKLDIPIPATHYPETIEQLAELDHLNPPFVLKPAIKEHFFYATKAKAWRANSHSELRTLYQKATELAGSGEIMVQELIPGGGSQQFSYCAFFRQGEALGKMVARRARQHPFEFGRASTYVETVDIPLLEELSERFLRAIDYYGLVEVEYKLDPRDSQYKLLDVNARTWGYHSLGAGAGVDFSYMLYCDQVGLPVPVCKGRPGVAWVRSITDLPAAMVAILNGDTDLKSYIRSLRRCNVEAVFSAEDPLPGLAEVALIPYLAIKRGF